jgi:hypothetical protein
MRQSTNQPCIVSAALDERKNLCERSSIAAAGCIEEFPGPRSAIIAHSETLGVAVGN